MPVDLNKVADVLEKAAFLLDAQEAEKQAAVREERERNIKNLAEKYAEATGEELTPEIQEKLANSSPDLLATVKKMVEKTANSVESLGHSSEQSVQSKPTTKKEAVDQAWDRFGAFINS